MPEHIYQKNDLIDNRYVVQQSLGEGHFSNVYKVLDILSSDVVALKVFKDATGVLDHLRDEFHVLKDLNHPRIARVFDLGQLPDRAYFLKLEYIQGNTLADLIRDGRISLAKARAIATDLLSALEYLHGQHVMHRDIKPSNIIIGERGTVIVDFNVSRQVENAASSQVGTPRYMPPEISMQGWNWTGDLYSLGIVLYEMLTGTYPFPDNRPQATVQLRDPREHNPSISESLGAAVLKAIAPTPADRFQSAREMAQALEKSNWEPVAQVRQSPPIDLSQIVPSPEEATKPNYNPYLTRLLCLYSQSRNTNAGTRGLDAFGRATYVPTRLDSALKPTILDGSYDLIIITGNAGDGKTAFIQNLEGAVEHDPATSYLERLASGNGTQFVHAGRHFLTNYDGSQDEGQINNDDVLARFFRPFGGKGPLRKTNQVHLIAINEGRLIDFLASHHRDFPYLAEQVSGYFDADESLDPRLLIVNLNLRAVIANGIDGIAIFDQMADRLTTPVFWERCASCNIADRCYVKFNADSLNDPNYGPQIRQRLKTLFQIAYFRQRLHITIRDLRSALAYLLFNVDDCDSIHRMMDNENDAVPYLKRFYYNALFDGDSQDRLVRLLAEVDPGQVANPKLDSRIAFVAPSEMSLMPPFDNRSRYDIQLLEKWQSATRNLEQNFSAEQREEMHDLDEAVVSLRRQSHSTLRRKIYFERVDEEWVKMLPYALFISTADRPGFSGLMQRGSPEELVQARDQLIHAISMSEGIFAERAGKDYLCLRTSQEPRVTIKSFRRFHKDHFRCSTRDIRDVGKYIEYEPPVLALEYEYEPGKTIGVDIALDLYEMLHRIHQGYTPSVNELRGPYINLLIFKRQLASTFYHEVMLTEDEQTYYRVQKTADHKLILTEGFGS